MSTVRRVIDVNGARVACSMTGDGSPVLLLNGLGANLSMWNAVTSSLAGCTVIAFDAPGVGDSPPVRTPYSMRGAARIALGVLEHLGVETADVLGYSLGGAVAQELTRIASERVRRLVLACTGCGWGGVPGSALAMASISTPLRYRSRLGYALTTPFVGGGRAERESGFLERTVEARLATPPSLLGYSLQLLSTCGWSSLAWLHTLEVPTLVVAGNEDPLVPFTNAVLLAGRMPQARLVGIPDWGHYVLLDRASGAPDTIARFLTASDLGTAPVWRSARTVLKPELARTERDGRFSSPAGMMNSAVRWWVSGPAPQDMV